jgi:pyrroline-5-carboxylate reductase
MIDKSIGFIGGGRVVRVILGGFKRAGEMPKQVVVGDTNIEVLKKLKEGFPEINIAPNDNKQPASKDIVFIVLHPPVLSDVLKEDGAGNRRGLNEAKTVGEEMPCSGKYCIQ